MATIDKPLPNISETVVKVPKQEELVEARDEIIEKKNQQGNIKLLWTKRAVRKLHLTQEL